MLQRTYLHLQQGMGQSGVLHDHIGFLAGTFLQCLGLPILRYLEEFLIY